MIDKMPVNAQALFAPDSPLFKTQPLDAPLPLPTHSVRTKKERDKAKRLRKLQREARKVQRK